MNGLVDGDRGPGPAAAAALLLALQLGDSAFPSGAFASSWGLEVLCAEGQVRDRETLVAFAAGQLRHRWATFDRVALVRAHRAGDLLDVVAEVDQQVEVATLAPLARAASRRAGRAVLGLHRALGWPRADAYLAEVRPSGGHLPVALGLVGRERGLGESELSAVAGYQFMAGLVSAGLRLGVVGHVGAQQALDELRPTLAALVDDLAGRPLPLMLASSAVAADEAMLRHEALPTRLFAC